MTDNLTLPPPHEQSDAPSTDEGLTAGRLIMLASLASLGALATNIMLPAFPAMAQALCVSTDELAWTLSNFFIVLVMSLRPTTPRKASNPSLNVVLRSSKVAEIRRAEDTPNAFNPGRGERSFIDV